MIDRMQRYHRWWKWFDSIEDPREQMYVLLAEAQGTSAEHEQLRAVEDGFADTLEEWVGVVERRLNLINAGVILLQEGRLRIGERVENRDVLVRELLDYRVRINISTAHDSYEPWREGAHDDLLFSTCLASWAWSRTPKAS